MTFEKVWNCATWTILLAQDWKTCHEKEMEALLQRSKAFQKLTFYLFFVVRINEHYKIVVENKLLDNCFGSKQNCVSEISGKVYSDSKVS